MELVQFALEVNSTSDTALSLQALGTKHILLSTYPLTK